MSAVVLGAGISGKAVAEVLTMRGQSFLIIDDLQEGVFFGASIQKEVRCWEGVDLVIFSPSVRRDHPVLIEAKKQGVLSLCEAEWALRQIQKPVIAVTGSNGKTTAVRFLEKAFGIEAFGNIGRPLSLSLLEEKEECIVLELSSFQLEAMQAKKLDHAFVLNIYPNHLDWHPSMQSYVEAKARIQDLVKEGGSVWISSQVKERYGSFFLKAKLWDKKRFFKEDLLQIASVLQPFFSKSSLDEIVQTFQVFRALPHRLEFVENVDGVDYINDSKATNVEAVCYAVKQISTPIILLCGGREKGSSYLPWKEIFQDKVKKIIVFGEAADTIEMELEPFFAFTRVEDLSEGLDLARKKAKKGDTVLLSPGCSSFDQFHNFEERGKRFKEKVRAWIEKKP